MNGGLERDLLMRVVGRVLAEHPQIRAMTWVQGPLPNRQQRRFGAAPTPLDGRLDQFTVLLEDEQVADERLRDQVRRQLRGLPPHALMFGDQPGRIRVSADGVALTAPTP